MNAAEAKTATREALEKDSARRQQALKKIWLCIKNRADGGYYNWCNPWQVETQLSREDKASITEILRGEGYSVVEHEDPDFGNPSSSGLYTEIRWD